MARPARRLLNAAALTEAPRVEEHEIEPLTVAQAHQLLDAVRGDPLEALYRIALSLGLRRGEILGLRRVDLDMQRRELRVSCTLRRISGKLVRTTPKTRASIRTLPVPDTLYQSLVEHLRRQDEQFPGAEYVFTSSAGTPIDPRNLLRFFKAALERAKLPQSIRFHDLRHSCVTFLIAQGEHPRVVMDILGHAQMSTTMDIYGHVMPSTQRAAATKLDGLLTPAPERPPDASSSADDASESSKGSADAAEA
jgi:integrase